VSNQSTETNQIKSISIDFSIKQSTIKSNINAMHFLNQLQMCITFVQIAKIRQ